MVFYFSLMSNKIPFVICCHELKVHVRNFLVKFTEQLHHFCHGLGATVNSCLFDIFRISEHLPIFCPISFCSVPIPSLTRQMFVHAVLQHPLTSRRWTLFLCTFSPTNFIPHLRLLPPQWDTPKIALSQTHTHIHTRQESEDCWIKFGNTLKPYSIFRSG